MAVLVPDGLSIAQLNEIRSQNADYRLNGDVTACRLFIAASERILNHAEFRRGSHAGEELELAPDIMQNRLKAAYVWLEARGTSGKKVRYADMREFNYRA